MPAQTRDEMTHMTARYATHDGADYQQRRERCTFFSRSLEKLSGTEQHHWYLNLAGNCNM